MRVLLAASLVALATAGCGDLLEPAAAVVAGDKITVEEVQRAVDDFEDSREFQRLSQQGDPGGIVRDFEQTYLAQLVRRAVFTPEAVERGIEVTEDEIGEQLEQIQAEFPSESAFREALKEQGLTLDQLQLLIRDRALEEKLRAAVVKEDAPQPTQLRDYYEAHRDDFLETETQHILVKEQGLAAELSDRLRDTPRKELEDVFARLARQHSKDKSNKDLGGALGFNPSGSFVPAFEAAADELDIGAISRPVKTRFGWHVIWVRDRRPTPFAQVENQIRSELGLPTDDELWDDWVLDAYEAAAVRVNPRYGELNLETQQIEDASARTVPGAEKTPARAPTPEASLP